MNPLIEPRAPRSLVKIRRLKSRVDAAAYMEAIVAPYLQPFASPDEESLFQSPFNAPKAVRGRTYEIEFRMAQAWIESGRLQLTDLIDVGRGWESVEDCIEVADEVDRRLDRLRRKRWLTAGAVIAGMGAIYFIKVYALLWIASALRSVVQ